ncbi:MAG TPA: glycosyltransferase family 2 protein [Polyangiales bacterium]|nr:glycosyltransferase family 2 protein [Polyangiales bacterium]
MTHRISVVINTWNEEQNLPWSLGSVRTWADEIVVVDMHSQDRTREIAESFDAKVYLHEWLGFADPARAFAIEKSHGDFVLLLDADEMIPEPLSRELQRIAREGSYDIAKIARSNYLLGKKLEHTGWGARQDRHLRFFRRGSLITSAAIHNFLHPVAGARICELPADPELCIVHFNYLDVTQFIEKLNRYTSVEAQQALERGKRETGWSTTRDVMQELFRRYVKKGGFRDGWRGFYLSLLMALYRVGTAAKLAELKAGMGPGEARNVYRKIAEELLSAYSKPE